MIHTLITFVTLLPTATFAPAEPPAAPPKYDRALSLDSRTLTGDWNGRRPAWQERGLTINAFFNDTYGWVLGGGLDTEGVGRNGASTDILISADLDKLKLIRNADALLHLQANWDASINPRVGALQQVFDDTDGSIGGHVAQFWYRHHFFDHRVSLMVGYLDYQTIVDRNAYANSEDKQFMNQSLDNNPLVPLKIGMGAALTIRPVTWYTLILGVADGEAVPYSGGISKAFHGPAWFTGYLENDFTVKLPSPRGPLPGNYRLGFLYDPVPRARFPRGKYDQDLRDDVGFYASLDQMVYRENAETEQGLGVFLRFAYRSPESNRIARFWSGGLSYRGLVPGRDADELGLGFSLERSGDPYRKRINREFTDETVYELYYAIQVTKWLVVTPDLQYVDNPGATGTISHALVGGFRVRVSF